MDLLVFFARTLALIFGWLGSLLLLYYAGAWADEALRRVTKNGFLELFLVLFEICLLLAFWATLGLWYVGG